MECTLLNSLFRLIETRGLFFSFLFLAERSVRDLSKESFGFERGHAENRRLHDQV